MRTNMLGRRNYVQQFIVLSLQKWRDIGGGSVVWTIGVTGLYRVAVVREEV